MKKILLLFVLFSEIKKANAFNSGLNVELTYIYGMFIALVLLIVGTEKALKYIFRKLKEHQRLNEGTNIDS